MPDEPELTEAEILAQQVRTLRTLWMAIAQVAILYAGILWFWLNGGEPRPRQELGAVMYILIGVGLSMSVMSFALRPLLLRGAALAPALERNGMSGFLGAVMSRFVVLWSLAESCAVMGLVIGLMTAQPLPSYGLIVLGFALVFAHPPNAHTLGAVLEAADRERARGGGSA